MFASNNTSDTGRIDLGKTFSRGLGAVQMGAEPIARPSATGKKGICHTVANLARTIRVGIDRGFRGQQAQRNEPLEIRADRVRSVGSPETPVDDFTAFVGAAAPTGEACERSPPQGALSPVLL